LENNDKAYHYHGGKILPGLNKMTQSLSKTDKLPWVDVSDNNAVIIDSNKMISSSRLSGFGLNTKDAIIAGVKSAMKGALLQTIDELHQQGFCELDIYVTGGDAVVYESMIAQCNLSIKPQLVFIGMLLANIDDLFAVSS
jgi:Putative transcriptional regulator, homolog of Bvg accessory factor